ncbi:MAG: HD domain-containing protein [bacterium]|nr:HD domain-containing protein [bacterium]
MEQLENFFKPADDSTKPIGQSSDIERHSIKPENVLTEREGSLEEIKRNYKPAMVLRESQYEDDVAINPKMKNQRLNLNTHNEIVFGYADELIRAHDLSESDKVAAYLAVIFHDSGKLANDLKEHGLDHHLKGSEYARRLLDELPSIKQGDKTIEITPDIKEKVLSAIERHMNHPFLVNLNKLNKGEPFPEPENAIDKIVFDADMMANVGFKNVCFRLISEKYLNEDMTEASRKGVPALEETFNNVMVGVRALDQVVLSVPAKKQIGRLIDTTEEIFKYLKDNRIFQEIQDKYSENNEFNFQTINQKPGGIPALKEELNLAIKNAARASKIDETIAKNFVM